MANEISLPNPQINPGSMGGGGLAPNPLDAFVTNFMAARQQKSSESAAARSHEIEVERLNLLKEDMKFRQEQERTKQAGTDAQGGGLQALIKALAPTIEAQGQYTPPGQLPPALTALGIGPQNQQQGPPQPAQGPNGPQGGQSAAPDPMQVFSGIVAGLPAGAVPEFVQHFQGIAQQAQIKKDQEKAFGQAERSTAGLLTPQQNDQLKTARLLWQSGAPEEIWKGMMPSAQIDLAKGLEEVRGMKNKREADRTATVQLQKLGLAAPKSGMDEVVIDGAAKILADYVSGVRKDARAAGIERAKTDREEAVKGVEGTALEIAVQNPDWSGAQIQRALRATPAYAGISDGQISKAAYEAPKKAQQLTAPANDVVAKARVVYGAGRAAMAVVNAMDAKGQSLGIAARAAQVTSGEAGKVGLGGGAGLGMMGGGPVGSIAGGLAGGAAGLVLAPLIRGAGRQAMGADQQRLWTAAQTLAASVYRPESGSAVTPDEIRTTLERYIPLSTDKPETRKLKRTLRDELDKTLANISQLPQQLQQQVLDGLLTKHEQAMGQISGAPAPKGDGTSW